MSRAENHCRCRTRRSPHRRTRLATLIRSGYVQAVLSGNALGVHDIEAALLGTSLGIRLADGRQEEHGHRNHMRAINAINNCGISGCCRERRAEERHHVRVRRNNVPFVLAGSLRDDGPLPDTITDMNVAQDLCAQHLKGAGLVLCLGSMLHSIAIGNMSPSWVKLVCVDINPAVATKVSDRGTGQAIGVVTDVGLFLDHLCRALVPEVRGMKREYTDDQAKAVSRPNCLRSKPGRITTRTTRSRSRFRSSLPSARNGSAGFRQADAALCAGRACRRIEVAEDVHAGVSQPGDLLGERCKSIPS